MSDASSLEKLITDMAVKAKQASVSLAPVSSEKKNAALAAVASILEEQRDVIQQENAKDLAAGRDKGLSSAMLDRLELSDAVIDSMISGLRQVIALPDPVGTIDNMSVRPNGLKVGRMRVPLGVVSMIYESRPNVTVDAAALCLKTGNSVILRGGSEAIHSNLILAKILQQGLQKEGIEAAAVQVIPVTDREAVNHLLKQEDTVDLVIPRGGEGLIRFVSEHSRIPVLKHYKGVCHIYVDKDADLTKAVPIIVNAKTHRPGVCNALEGLLVHKSVAEKFIPQISDSLTAEGVELKGCQQSTSLSDNISAASPEEWGEEFLDLKLVVKLVDDIEEAKSYIREHGSNHTECIITENYTTAMGFVREVDASAVMVNSSTRFNDGGELGLGTEIGISTTKLHAYGPMGLEELTARKFIVFGDGQIR